MREGTIEGVSPILASLQDRRTVPCGSRTSCFRWLAQSRTAPPSKPLKPIDLIRLVQETGAEWAPRALASDIEMQFASDEEDPVMILGDPDLLREAIGNLIDNAIKYQKSPGTIELSVTRFPAPAIVVEDTGPGIPPELRASMLQRFVRGERGEGTGLGLPITQEIARVHRGELVLEAGSANRGLRARVIFPAPAPREAHLRQEPESSLEPAERSS